VLTHSDGMAVRDRWPSSAGRCPVTPLVLVVAINLAFFFVFPRLIHSVGAETGTDGYKEIAENIVQGNGFVFAPEMHSTMMLGYIKREPVYPLLLAGVLWVTGTLNPAVLCLFQTLLCAVSCYLLYHLGTRVFDDRTGRATAYLYALHPISFWYTARFASEMAAIPVLLACLLVIERFFDRPTRAKAALLGLSIGVAALTKSAYVVLLPLVLLFAVVRWHRQIRRLLASALLVVVAYASVHSLWIARNYALTGEIVPLTTMTGVAFFLGNRIVERFDLRTQTAGTEPDKWAWTFYRSVQSEIEARNPSMPLPNLEVATDRELTARSRQLMLGDPLFAARKVLAGTLLIWFLSDTTAKSLGWAAFQLPLLAFALLGIYAQREWTFKAVFLLSVVAVFLLAYAAVSPLARYAMPVMPLVMCFSSLGLLSALKTIGYLRPVQAAV